MTMVRRKINVLSIDGGGIRGIIPASLLIEIEKLIKTLSRNPEAEIADYFDLIAGTSTGGILAALLLEPSGQYNATDMLSLYQTYGSDIFTRHQRTRFLDRRGLFSPLYSDAPMNDLLKRYLGELKMSELKKPALIPTYNIESGSATFISGIEILKQSAADMRVRDVLRSTIAAPTYFTPKQLAPDAAYVDGGLFANNPALCAYIEATKFPSEPHPEDIHILSLGTGSIHRRYPYERAKGWGKLGWMLPVLNIYASAASQTVDHQLAVMYAGKAHENNYLRIEPNLENYQNVRFEMDDASDANMKALEAVGLDLYVKHETELKTFIKNLVLNDALTKHQQLYERNDSSDTSV